MLRPDDKWDYRFLELCDHISEWSKDPSTKVGAVITKGNRIVSLGYNGFPADIGDHHSRLHDREEKYDLTIHAEPNAILFANRDLTGYTIYTNLFPCIRCSVYIIQAGLSRIVSYDYRKDEDRMERWGPSFIKSHRMFSEAGRIVTLKEKYG